MACLKAKASVDDSCKHSKQHKASYKAITAVSSISKPLQLLHMDLFGTEFKNAHIIELCGSKGIKRDYSNARTPQQNGVAKRKNRTLIEAARTMLADSKLPTMFWTEAVRTACYVLNRVLVDWEDREGYICLDNSASTISLQEHKKHQLTQQYTRMLNQTQNVMNNSSIIPSYPSHNLQEAEPKDTSSDDVDDSPHDSSEKIFST
ncbi:putative ribonuclease H-like domain-containing protein [Tanacetum coccineum]